MASSARQAIRTGYAETSATITGMVPTLLLICITTVVLGGADDRVLLSGGEVDTPLVGQTRYELFMVIAPGMIVVMRIFIELQMAHLNRLSRIMRSYKIRRPVRLSGQNNLPLAIAGLVAIHIMPVATIGFLARQVSAVYPQMAMVLFTLAAALALISGWSIFERDRPSRIALGVALPAFLLVGGATVLHNRVIQASGAFGASSSCAYAGSDAYTFFAAAYFRPVDVEKQSFPSQQVKRMHMVCGNLNDTKWQDADIREALLTGADMRDADLQRANVGGAVFENAILRDADLRSINGYESRFHGADLSGALFHNADLLQTRFVEGILGRTEFLDARIAHATFWRADIDAASFQRTKILFSKFIEAVIYEVDFQNAELLNVDFFQADLESVSFAGANLAEVTFEDAVLYCVDFTGAVLDDVDFTGVDPEFLRTVKLSVGRDETRRYVARPTVPPARDVAERARIIWPEGFDPIDAGADFDTECRPI